MQTQASNYFINSLLFIDAAVKVKTKIIDSKQTGMVKLLQTIPISILQGVTACFQNHRLAS